MDHLKSRLGVVLARMVRKFLLWNCFYLLMFNHFFPGNATQPWNWKLGAGVDCKRNMARGFLISCDSAMNWKWKSGPFQTRRDLSGLLKLASAPIKIREEA